MDMTMLHTTHNTNAIIGVFSRSNCYWTCRTRCCTHFVNLWIKLKLKLFGCRHECRTLMPIIEIPLNNFCHIPMHTVHCHANTFVAVNGFFFLDLFVLCRWIWQVWKLAMYAWIMCKWIFSMVKVWTQYFLYFLFILSIRFRIQNFHSNWFEWWTSLVQGTFSNLSIRL